MNFCCEYGGKDNMELKRLEYFEAICRLKNFTKAAEELHVAQPSITVSIKKLEEELGVELLCRNQHSVTITNEGELFLKRVRQILYDMQNAVNEIEDFGSKARSILKFGIPTSLGSWMFPMIFSDYAQQYPKIKIQAYEMGVQKIIESLNQEIIEAGFIVLDKPIPRYSTLLFSKGQMLVVFSKDHPFNQYEKISFELLKEERFVLCAGGSYIKKRFMSECENRGIVPQIIFTPIQVATVFNMVASGAGISFVLSDEIAMLKDNPRIMTRPLENPIEFETGFIWKKDRYLSRVARDFMQFIQKYKEK
jgi:DNA-binding transcriptional LysR family regulator